MIYSKNIVFAMDKSASFVAEFTEISGCRLYAVYFVVPDITPALSVRYNL